MRLNQFLYLLETKTKLDKKQTSHTVQDLLNVITESILEKKGEEVISMDLTNLPDAMSTYFVICEGMATTQVRAIADNITYNAKYTLDERALHVEGLGTSEWVLIDFVDVVVHIFLRETRKVYMLEELWGDAAITTRYFEDGTQAIEQ